MGFPITGQKYNLVSMGFYLGAADAAAEALRRAN